MLIQAYPNNEIRITRGRCTSRQKREPRPLLLVPPALDPSILDINHRVPQSLERTKKVMGVSPGYGGRCRPTRFTVNARQTILRSGPLLGEGEPSSVAFVTLTLPGSTPAACNALADWSAYIVNRLLLKVSRTLNRPLAEIDYIWVWEWQKRGALHFHAAIDVGAKRAIAGLEAALLAEWRGLMNDVGRQEGCDMAGRRQGGTWADRPDLWQCKAEPCRKSPGAYLSKYLSKGTKPVGGRDPRYPSRWWGVSRCLRGKLKEATVAAWFPERLTFVDPVAAEGVIDLLAEVQAASAKAYAYQHKFSPAQTFVFYLPEESYMSDRDRLIKGVDRLFAERRPTPAQRCAAPVELDWLLERCHSSQRVAVRLIDEMTPFQKDAYELYYDDCSLTPAEVQELRAVCWYVLIAEGLESPVNPASAAGVDREGPSSRSNSGGADQREAPPWPAPSDPIQSDLFPGMP